MQKPLTMFTHLDRLENIVYQAIYGPAPAAATAPEKAPKPAPRPAAPQAPATTASVR